MQHPAYKNQNSRQLNEMRRQIQIAEQNKRLLQRITKGYERGEEESIHGVFPHTKVINTAAMMCGKSLLHGVFHG